MSILAADVKAHAHAMGADLVGIAPITRFTDVPAQHHPASIMPEAQSVIVLAARITRGALRGVEEGTQMTDYAMYGRDWLYNRVLATAIFHTAEFLEDYGWEAVPIQNLPPQTPPMGIPVRPGQPAPNVMLDVTDAAVRAGLGEIGYCGFFLTPQFGHRQRMQLILTDAVLDADDLLEKAVCTRCRDHARFCPLGAIDPAHEETISICGKEMTVAAVNDARCRGCKNGASPNLDHPSGKADRLGAVCARSCLHFLESNNLVENTFHTAFRNRPPWAVIDESRTVLLEEV